MQLLLGAWQSVLFNEFSSIFGGNLKSQRAYSSALVAGLLFPGGISGSLLLLPHKVTPEVSGAPAQEVLSRGWF